MEEKLKKIVEEQNLEQENPEELALLLWQVLKQYEQVEFQTVKGLAFTYVIKGNEMFIDRKEKSITKSSVLLAFQNLVKQGGIISGPKSLEHLGRVIYIRFYGIRMDCGVTGFVYTGEKEKILLNNRE